MNCVEVIKLMIFELQYNRAKYFFNLRAFWTGSIKIFYLFPCIKLLPNFIVGRGSRDIRIKYIAIKICRFGFTAADYVFFFIYMIN